MAQLVEGAYRHRGRKITVGARMAEDLSAGAPLSDDDVARLQPDVQADVCLGAPRQLLLGIRDLPFGSKIRTQVLRFVRGVLLESSAMRHPRLAAALRDDDLHPSLADLLRLAATPAIVPDGQVPAAAGSEALKARSGATNCLALYLAEVHQIPVSELADGLAAGAWPMLSAAPKTTSEQVRLLTEPGDFATVRFVAEIYGQKAKEAKRAAEVAIRALEDLRDHSLRLDAELQASRQTAARLREQLEAEAAAHREETAARAAKADAEATRHRDTMETLRTRVLRRLVADIALLEQGLEALNRPQPKVHVMADAAERVTDALRAEIDKLHAE